MHDPTLEGSNQGVFADKYTARRLCRRYSHSLSRCYVVPKVRAGCFVNYLHFDEEDSLEEIKNLKYLYLSFHKP
jgi:hypothetical protein